MFTRYWRDYPFWLQFFLFLLMLFALVGVGFMLAIFLMPTLIGYSVDKLGGLNENSPISLINGALLLQVILDYIMFLAPALLFAHLTHPRPAAYLGLKKPGKPVQWVLTITLMLGAIPVLLAIPELFKNINFGNSFKSMQQATDNEMKAFLKMNTPLDLVKTFFVLAITPALCEELFFRGIGLRFLSRGQKNMIFPIIMSALIFAIVHSNPEGFISIFLAGILLAVIYYLTGSLWCSMLAHLMHNGLQVVLLFLAKNNAMADKVSNSDSIPPVLIIGGFILFASSLYLLIKNKTPLPPDWTKDFSKEELNQIAA